MALDLSGIGVVIEALPHTLAERLLQDFSAFLGEPAGEPLLAVAIEQRDVRPSGAYRPKAMSATIGDDRAVFEMAGDGRAEVRAAGDARIELAAGDDDRPYFTLLNLLRACLAWRLPDRGGALLHAAGLLVGGRAFVLVGGEGAGKSTWARLGEQAGLRVLSDDVVLVDGLEIAGAPFRSTYRGELCRGRWPLAAMLFPVHGRPARLAPAAPLLSRARLAANLPFIAEAIERDLRVVQLVERLATAVPCRELTFDLDRSFVEVLRRFP